MELNAEQQVLLAMYIEYKKDLPNMDTVKAEYLGMETAVFYEALDKLDSKDYLINFKQSRGGKGNKIYIVWLAGVSLRSEALREAESLLAELKFKENTAENATMNIFKTLKEDTKDLIAKYFAELSK